jgi:hypothetical protein
MRENPTEEEVAMFLAEPHEEVISPEYRLLERSLDDWIATFPVDRVRKELDALKRQKGSLEAAIDALNRRLALWQAAKDGIDDMHVLVGRRNYPPKRDAILHYLAERDGQVVRLGVMRDALIERGWLAHGKKAAHAFEVTAANLVRRGEIERVRKGYYRSVPLATEPRQAVERNEVPGPITSFQNS